MELLRTVVNGKLTVHLIPLGRAILGKLFHEEEAVRHIRLAGDRLHDDIDVGHVGEQDSTIRHEAVIHDVPDSEVGINPADGRATLGAGIRHELIELRESRALESFAVDNRAPEVCTGCELCVSACPVRAMEINLM